MREKVRVCTRTENWNSKVPMEEFSKMVDTGYDFLKYLSTILPKNEIKFTGLTIVLFTDTKAYEIIQNECKKHGFIIDELHLGYQYTKKEIDNAEYFIMYPDNFGKEWYTESYQTEYEAKGIICNACGHSIKKQISELYIDKTLFKNRDIGRTTNNEIVISENLHNIFVENPITGITFRNVNHKNTKMKNEPKLYQLIIENVLPPMHNDTQIFPDSHDYCHVCKTYGNYLTGLVKYEKNNDFAACDFNLTHEYLGGGYLSERYPVISKKVYNLLKNYKIKGWKSDIVEFV